MLRILAMSSLIRINGMYICTLKTSSYIMGPQMAQNERFKGSIKARGHFDFIHRDNLSKIFLLAAITEKYHSFTPKLMPIAV